MRLPIATALMTLGLLIVGWADIAQTFGAQEEKRTMELEQRVQAVLKQKAPEGWRESGITRERYLDLMERILTVAAQWQDERGAIIDPVDGKEHGQTSCRFVAPGAILLSADRCEQLREKVLKGMDWSCSRLAKREADSPDFWMREIMTAWNSLQNVDPARRARWEEDIRAVDPEKTYKFISPDGTKLHTLHNWAVYASAGEAMRSVTKLGPRNDDGTTVWGAKYFEKYMPAQCAKFSELGMYRDPNDPFTYDITTRLQIMTAFASGYKSPLQGQLDDLLRRGALAQLLYVSPEGYAPYGGRSSQMQLQEAILAAVCELEARRYRESNPQLARAFKRMAHIHVKSIEPWIMDMNPPRHIKNGFSAETRHGSDPYGKVSVYSLFAASCLGLAYQYADETISEEPAPAEIGGYAITLTPAFHKVFATCGGTQIEIDLAADLHYDATGLGRFMRVGVPMELGLAMPMTTHPKYELPETWMPKEPLAIGPRWRKKDGQWMSLAAMGEGTKNSTVIERESQDEVVVRVTWDAGEAKVTQRYRLTAGQVAIEAEVTGTEAVALTVPLLKTDGAATSTKNFETGKATVRYRGSCYNVDFDPSYIRHTEPEIANRNGVYEVMSLETTGGKIGVILYASQIIK